MQGCVTWRNVCLSTVWSVWLVLPWRGPHVQPWSHRSTAGYAISRGGGLLARAYSPAAVLQKCRLLWYKCMIHTGVLSILGFHNTFVWSHSALNFCIWGISIYKLLICGGYYIHWKHLKVICSYVIMHHSELLILFLTERHPMIPVQYLEKLSEIWTHLKRLIFDYQCCCCCLMKQILALIQRQIAKVITLRLLYLLSGSIQEMLECEYNYCWKSSFPKVCSGLTFVISCYL